METEKGGNNISNTNIQQPAGVESLEIQGPTTTATKTETYEQTRHRLKYGQFQTYILVFKSTVGLGIFSYEFIIGKSGIILSLILSIFSGFFTTYSMWRLVTLCDILEKERGIYKDVETPDIEIENNNENEQQINAPSHLNLLEIKRFQGTKKNIF